MNTVELMGDPAEQFAGGPKIPSWGSVGTKMTAKERTEFNAARQAYNEAANQWAFDGFPRKIRGARQAV
jgi:hypothetical protein